jgi:hypothetical protein
VCNSKCTELQERWKIVRSLLSAIGLRDFFRKDKSKDFVEQYDTLCDEKGENIDIQTSPSVNFLIVVIVILLFCYILLYHYYRIAYSIVLVTAGLFY